MPYASSKQAAFMHANHPSIAARWDKEGSTMDDSDKAMKAVIDDMGRHARNAKARRYMPMPQPAALDPHDMTTGEMSESDLQRLLNQQHNSVDDADKELQVQR